MRLAFDPGSLVLDYVPGFAQLKNASPVLGGDLRQAREFNPFPFMPHE
jgi:hypothetical protein